MTSAVNELSGGRYRVTRALGRGSQGEVLLAHDTLLSRAVVLKRVGVGDDEAQARAALGDELRLLAGLRHPNVVEVFELFEQRASLYLVESYAPGVNPLAWVAAGAPADRIARACRVVAALLRGAEYLHARGIIHRDIKPDNARVELDGEIGRLPAARLFDLGLATRAPAPEVTGTLAYAAPEVRAGAAASVASDLYSVGVLLHEALLGERPDAERDVRRFGLGVASAAGLPGLLVELLRDMLAREPEQRPLHGAIFEALSATVGAPLQLTADDLSRDYFPRSPPVGAETMAQAVESLADEAAAGRRLIVAVDDTPDEIAELLRARAQLCGLRLVRVAPRLEAAAGAAEPARIATRIADELLAQSRPTLVDLLDCAADSSAARALAAQLSRAAAPTGRLVLASAALLGELGADHRLVAPPLSRLEAREMARALLYHLDAPWIDALADAAGGDRRLVAALVAAQIDAGLPEQLVVPADLSAASSARLAALSAGERALIDALALSPRSLPLQVARAAALLDEVEPTALVVRGLVTVDEAGLRLASLPLRRAAREAIAETRRRALHLRLVAAWRQVTPSDPRALAHHLLAVDEAAGAAAELLRLAAIDDDALDDLLRAQRALTPVAAPRGAGEGVAPAGSADAAATAVADEPLLWLDLTVRLARVQRARGEVEKALALADDIEPCAAARALALRAELLLDAGRADEALVVLQRADTPGSAIDAGAVSHQATRALLTARAHFVGGDYDAAERSARVAASSGRLDAASRARAANLVALARLYRGEVEAALQTLEPAVEEARAEADAESLARLDATRGIALSRLGRLEDAQAAYAECLEQAQHLGDLLLSASAALNLGTLAQRRGRLGDAYRHVGRAVSLARRGDMRATLAMALANLGNLQLYFGALDEADHSLAQAVDTARAAGATTHAGHAELYRAELALARGQLAAAEQALTRARAAFGDDAAGRDAADLFACELLLAAERFEEALARAAELGRRLAEGDPDRWITELARGRALIALERDAEAATLLESARAAAGEHERSFECEAALARCLVRLGRDADAARRAERCRQRLDRARADVPRPLRAAFDRRPAVRAALAIADELDRRGVEGRASAAQLRRLLEVNQALNRFGDLDELLRTILDCLLELTGGEQGAVLLVPGDPGEASVRRAAPLDIDVVAARHLEGSVTAGGMQRFSRSIARRAIAEDRPIVAADAAQDERFESELSVHGLQLRAVLCVPVHVQASVRGALYVDNRYRVGAFDGAAIELAQAFADQAGIALESARLLERAAHTEEQLRRAKAALEARGRELEARVEAQSEKLSAIELRLRSQHEELVRRYNAAHIIGRSKPMRELYLKLDRVADADVSLFIHGESGTGKELVARAIHAGGRRAEQPFVTVNCGAIPETLLESELFGHVRGAFTGALRDRPGLFEVAGEGTLLLDEVGDMPREMQVKLLRVLQEARFRRVGDDRERAAHCRVIAASHRDLERLVADGAFREDLFYRLQVIKLVVPPLRERREDIPLLVAHLLGDDAPRVLPQALRALIDYDWPGNVRQLENELARARVLADGDIGLADLSPPLRGIEVRAGEQPSEQSAPSLAEAVDKTERQLIERALAQTGFNVSRAAERLGIHRVALHRKIRKHGIERRRR